jgi:hypothetical protein
MRTREHTILKNRLPYAADALDPAGVLIPVSNVKILSISRHRHHSPLNRVKESERGETLVFCTLNGMIGMGSPGTIRSMITRVNTPIIAVVAIQSALDRRVLREDLIAEAAC